MPIIGRTDKSPIEKSFPLNVSYRLWKGEPKGERSAGRDLKEKFRFSGSDRYVDEFAKHYGGLYPTQVKVYLPFPTVEETFETWNESYTAQSLQFRCNGERIIEEKTRIKVGKNWQFGKQKCDRPCQKPEGANICDECKATGRFFFYVSELYQAGMGSTRCGMMAISGINDVIGLTNQLRALEAKYGNLMSSPIPSPMTHGYIPYILTREEKQIMRPAKPGADYQARGTAWVLTISEDPEWLALMQQWAVYQQVQALQGNPALAALVAGNSIAPAALPQTYGAVEEVRAIAPAASPKVEKDEEEPGLSESDRGTLNAQIDDLLAELGWNENKFAKAREYLKSRYKANSRSKLSDEQLLEFAEDLTRLVNELSQKVEQENEEFPDLSPETIEDEAISPEDELEEIEADVIPY